MLGRTRARDDDPRRHRPHPPRAGERLQGRHVASSQRLVPGDGDIPIARILGDLVDAGYDGFFELELIGDAIVAEGYDAAVPRAVDALDALLDELGA